MAPKNEIVYRNRFVKKYNRLFYDTWKIYRFSPLQGLFWLNTLSRQKKMPALFISLPGDEERYGGCLAAGRGIMHISFNQKALPFLPCPHTLRSR